MKLERHLKIWHVIATVQFAVSAALAVFWWLGETGLSWSGILSLSVQGLAVLVLAVLVYAFAVSVGAVGERIEDEYPLTASVTYRLFYVVTPILGGLVAGTDYLMAEGLRQVLRGWALGTLVAACAVWLVLDPVLSLVERALPQSRRLRALRAAQKKKRQEAVRRRRLERLEGIRARRERVRRQLEPTLEKRAARLSELLARSSEDPTIGFDEGASIGVDTWRIGGIELMKELFELAVENCRRQGREDLSSLLDYWSDGIGEWRPATSR